MKTVKGYVKTRMSGSRCTFEFEVEDETTPEEIEEHAKDALFNEIEWNFTVEEPDA